MSNIPRKIIEAKGQLINQWFYGYYEINNIIFFIEVSFCYNYLPIKIYFAGTVQE